MKNWRIIISSGGTITPIDKMRMITNKAAWITWATIAEEYVRQGQKITYVATGKSVFPFVHEIQTDPFSVSPEEAASKVIELQESIRSQLLNVIQTPYFDDYKNTMIEIAQSSTPWDVAIIAAAVSDFGMKQVVDGKISSSEQELNLDLAPLPKVINEMRKVSESLVMIGFKLLPAATTERETKDLLIASSLKQMSGASKTDCVVANASYAPIGEARMKIQNTMLVFPDGSYIEIARSELSRSELSRRLLDIIPNLITKRMS